MSWDEYVFEDPWESYDRGNEEYQNHNNSYDDNTYIRRKKYPIDKRSLELANTLKGLLKKEGILITGIHKAGSGSCYISFLDERLGKCRVGNHAEKGNVGYRWQIRTDIESNYISNQKGHRQYFYKSGDLEGVVKHMKNYLNKIKSAEDEFKCV